MTEFRNHSRAVLWVVCALPLAAIAGSDSIDRKVAADANGEVVISNVSGTIDVRGWDRNEVQVTGHLGRGVERVDVKRAAAARSSRWYCHAAARTTAMPISKCRCRRTAASKYPQSVPMCLRAACSARSGSRA